MRSTKTIFIFSCMADVGLFFVVWAISGDWKWGAIALQLTVSIYWGVRLALRIER